MKSVRCSCCNKNIVVPDHGDQTDTIRSQLNSEEFVVINKHESLRQYIKSDNWQGNNALYLAYQSRLRELGNYSSKPLPPICEYCYKPFQAHLKHQNETLERENLHYSETIKILKNDDRWIDQNVDGEEEDDEEEKMLLKEIGELMDKRDLQQKEKARLRA